MKIPDYLLDKFDKESKAIGWGEIIIKATFRDGKLVFFFDKHTSEKHTPDSISVTNDSCAMEVKTD